MVLKPMAANCREAMRSRPALNPAADPHGHKMKKGSEMNRIGLVALTCASSLLFVSPSTAMPVASLTAMAGVTNSNADDGIVAFCKGDIVKYPTEHLGNCMAIQTTSANGSNGTVPNICLFVQNVAPDFFDQFYDTIGDCVHDGASFGG